MYCSFCGSQLDENANFCQTCGKGVNNIVTLTADEQDINKKNSRKNVFVKLTVGSILLQAVLLALSSMSNTAGLICFALSLILTLAIFVFSILCVVNSKKCGGKGKKFGIVLTVFSSLVLAIVIIAVVFVGMFDNQSSETKMIRENIDKTAGMSVEILKENLKDPSSLKINKMYAIVFDTRITAQFSDGTHYDGGEFEGYFEIYIDYSARNGFGGMNRTYCYFKYDEKLNLLDYEEIESMPRENQDSVWILDASDYE